MYDYGGHHQSPPPTLFFLMFVALVLVLSVTIDVDKQLHYPNVPYTVPTPQDEGR